MRRTATRLTGGAILGLCLSFIVGGTSLAQTDQPSDQVLAEGRVVFEANCTACHQVDGAGIPGVFPPLAGNPNVMDADHVRTVLADGLTGVIVVNGTTYDSIMPPFAALTPDQVDSVIAYLQFGLNGAPTATTVPPTDTPTGDDGSSVTKYLLYGLALVLLVAAGWLLYPSLSLRKAADGESFGTLDVWVKTIVIVLFFVVFTVMLPSIVIKAGFLSSLPRLARDVLGAGVWIVFLGGGFFLLRRAQKSRVL